MGSRWNQWESNPERSCWINLHSAAQAEWYSHKDAGKTTVSGSLRGCAQMPWQRYLHQGHSEVCGKVPKDDTELVLAVPAPAPSTRRFSPSAYLPSLFTPLLRELKDSARAFFFSARPNSALSIRLLLSISSSPPSPQQASDFMGAAGVFGGRWEKYPFCHHPLAMRCSGRSALRGAAANLVSGRILRCWRKS